MVKSSFGSTWIMEQCLSQERVWFDQQRYEQAEANYQQILAQRHSGLHIEGKAIAGSALDTEVEKAMNLIGESLKALPSSGGGSRSRGDVEQRLTNLERENSQLKSTVAKLQSRLTKLEETVGKLTGAPSSASKAPPPVAEDDDDDFDFFGSDEEGAKVEQSQPVETKMKSKKAPVVAKSNILLDVKPWDDETDIAEMEKQVRSIIQDGLVWGASKQLPVAYGIKKLQISCVVEDDKVGTDFLEEAITAFEDYVQSVDIVAFNKI